MYQYLENLRKKPAHHKHRFSVLVSGVITGAIFLAWISVILPDNSARLIVTKEERERIEISDSSQTPFEALRNGTAAAWESFRAIINGASEFDLEKEYTSMKEQVESGAIELAPQKPID